MVREQMGRFNRGNSQAELPPLWQPGRIVADDAGERPGAPVVRRPAPAGGLLFHRALGLLGVDGGAGRAVFSAGCFATSGRCAGGGRRPGPPPRRCRWTLPEHRLHYLRPVPVAATLVVVFSLAPFFDLHAAGRLHRLAAAAAAGDAHGAGLAQLAAAAVLVLGGHLVAFFALTFAYAHAGAGAGRALGLLLLNVGAVALGWRLSGATCGQHRLLAGFVRPVALLFMGLQRAGRAGQRLRPA